LFIDASREFAHDKRVNRLRDEDADKIVTAFTKFQTIDGYAYRATPDELKANDFNLSVGRYISAIEPEASVAVDATQFEVDRLEEELAAVREIMATYVEELRRESSNSPRKLGASPLVERSSGS